MDSPLESAWIFFGNRLYGDYADIPPNHGWVKVKCVVHLESRPSAVVNVEAGKWRCYAGCGRGDVYDLIGATEHLHDFLDQKRYAADKGWFLEEEAPEPSVMNPNPRARKAKAKKEPWRPAWI